LPAVKIAVCVKQVPEAGAPKRIDPETMRLDRSGEAALNQFDVNAVEEALRIGLVSAVFPPEELLEKTLEVAQSLAAKSPLVLAAAKQLTNLSLQGQLEAGLGGEAERFAELFASEDQKEGMRAFVEKREPRFTGR
jgi:enoyl-CoA hydratase/carnithine racemase